MNTDEIYIIVPVYNEQPDIVRKTSRELLAHYQNVVVVNDGSDVAFKSHLLDLPVFYLTHAINLGQGAALQTGTDFAIRWGAEGIVHFDADGQHLVDDISRMLLILGEQKVDIVMGSRFLKYSRTVGMPVLRSILLRVACLVNGLFTGVWLSDAHNGLRVMNRKAASQIRFTENRQAHATQLLLEIKKLGLSYAEFPSTTWYSDYTTQKGQSSFNSFNVLVDLILNRLFK